MSELTYTLKDGTEIDYSTEAGLRLLDCEIARRYGWTDIRKADPPIPGRGDWVARQAGSSLEFTVWPYTADTNIALTILNDLRATIYKLREGWVVKIEWGKSVTREVLSPHMYGNTLALAICLAWLAMKDAEND
jgi:hypothetical protein